MCGTTLSVGRSSIGCSRVQIPAVRPLTALAHLERLLRMVDQFVFDLVSNAKAVKLTRV